MGHNHDHSHNHSEGNVKVAFFLNLSFTIIEVIGGLYTNSLAILSDALHDMEIASVWDSHGTFKSSQRKEEQRSFLMDINGFPY